MNVKREIDISLTSVLNEVHKTSAYIGGKSVGEDGQSLYPRLASTDEDEEMLKSYLGDAKSEVVSLLRQFVSGVSEYEDEEGGSDYWWHLVLLLPEDCKASLYSTLDQRIVSYLVKSVLCNWLITCGARSLSEPYAEEVVGIGNEIRALVHTGDGSLARDSVAKSGAANVVGGAALSSDDEGSGAAKVSDYNIVGGAALPGDGEDGDGSAKVSSANVIGGSALPSDLVAAGSARADASNIIGGSSLPSGDAGSAKSVSDNTIGSDACPGGAGSAKSAPSNVIGSDAMPSGGGSAKESVANSVGGVVPQVFGKKGYRIRRTDYGY